jgi:hypothetical protein
VGEAIAILVCAVLVWFLWVLVRFSIISPWLTRGAPGRLRRPEPDGVEAICGFPPPPEWVRLYVEAPFVERDMEFDLLDRAHAPPRRWTIGEFYPLTARDLREARTVHGVREGIPIAGDLDKGVYVVTRSGAVVLRSPNVPGGEVAVARSADDLRSFEPRELAEEVSDERS